MSEYCIETRNRDDRLTVIERIRDLGLVVNSWADGSFNFKTYDGCEDELSERMESEFPEIEYKLV